MMRYWWMFALCALVAAWHFHCHASPPATAPSNSRATERSPQEANPRITADDEPSKQRPKRQPDIENPNATPDATPDATRPDTSNAIRVGTWNTRRLGHGNKRVDAVASVIESAFDVIALQEVMNEDGVVELLEHLPGWDAEMSSRPVGTGKYKEWYAVLYRADAVDLQRSFIVRDRGDAFIREPFVVCMRADAFDFCLVNVHIIFGSRAKARDAEVNRLGDVVTRLRANDREKDWIVVGDFNRSPRTRAWERLRASGWRFTFAGRVATSLGKTKYSNPYDHILIDDRHTSELIGQAVRIDIVDTTCAGDFEACRLTISDHAPVMAQFALDGIDDD